MSGWLDDQNEAVAIDDLDAGPGLQRSGGASAPSLSLDLDPPLPALPRQGLTLRAEQRPGAGDHGSAARSEQHATTNRKRPAVTTTPSPITQGESSKPGREGNIMIAPITNATMPAIPMAPKAPMCTSASMRPAPSSTRPAPA